MHGEVDVDWDVRSVIAYALAAGATPLEELERVYEARGFEVFTAFAAHLLRRWIPARVRQLRAHGWPAQLIATEQWQLHHGTIPPEGRARVAWEVVSDVPWRRGVASSIRAELTVDGVTLVSGETVATSREIPGGYPVRTGDDGALPDLWALTTPRTEPVASLTIGIADNQSALFRLALDLRAAGEPADAMHIDPAAAHALGLAAPILHAGHIEALIVHAAGRSASVTPVAARIEYRKPVYVGRPLRADLWQEDSTTVLVSLTEQTGGITTLARLKGRFA